MLLQTNSYIVPKDKRNEHARLLRRFRQTLMRLGCDHFEVYEQVGANWTPGEATNRFVQIMRFRDRRHQLEVQTAERADPIAQQLIVEFCELINFKYQQEQGLFAVGFYTSFLRMPTARTQPALENAAEGDEPTPESIAAMQAAMANSPEPGVIPESESHADSAAGMSLSGRWNDESQPPTSTENETDREGDAESNAADAGSSVDAGHDGNGGHNGGVTHDEAMHISASVDAPEQDAQELDDSADDALEQEAVSHEEAAHVEEARQIGDPAHARADSVETDENLDEINELETVDPGPSHDSATEPFSR